MFHFLFCINPLDLSFFSPCSSLQISFSCIGFPCCIFLQYLLLLYTITYLYLKISSSHRSDYFRFFKSMSQCFKFMRHFKESLSCSIWLKWVNIIKDETILVLRYTYFDINLKIFHHQLSLWHIHSIVHPVLLFMLEKSFSKKFIQFTLTESARDSKKMKLAAYNRSDRIMKKIFTLRHCFTVFVQGFFPVSSCQLG